MVTGIKTNRGEAKFLNVVACSSVKLPFLNYEDRYVSSFSHIWSTCLLCNDPVFKCRGSNLCLYLYLETNQTSSRYLPHISLQILSIYFRQVKLSFISFHTQRESLTILLPLDVCREGWQA